MRHVPLPSSRSLPLIVWTASALMAAMALLSPTPSASALLFASFIGLVGGQSLRNRYFTKKLLRDAHKLANSVDLLEQTEGLSGIGRWCIECEPRRHLWSEEMCHLAGLPPGTAPRADILHRIMPEGMEQIELLLEIHKENRETYVIEFAVQGRGEDCSMLRARAKNIFAEDGTREQVFMVVRDVSEKYRLTRDRDEALKKAEKARADADTDVLTGLGSRRYTMAQLDEAVMRARKRNSMLSLIVFDIDHFKQVNDRYGHPVGDKVIAMIGTIAARHSREFDSIGRIGGEEFLWILPDCDCNAADRAAERLRWAVEAGTHSAPIPSITISVGHAQLQPDDAALTLFARADHALFEAKRTGRNRVAQAA